MTTIHRGATRRSLLVLGTAGLIIPNIAWGQTAPVVETTTGKVRGADLGVVKAFKGIPYGADTSGKNRFMPPKKPQAWAGVRDALAYGNTAPQVRSDPARDYVQLIGWDKPVAPMSEDCLNLNVWTRGLADGGKRPVLVSFHGGGWVNGSGQETGYDGEAMVRFDDVVCVTVNHRLGALGYIDLPSLRAPSEFGLAGVAGVLDMVAALEWVRDNIQAFGGDPNCVMIVPACRDPEFQRAGPSPNPRGRGRAGLHPCQPARLSHDRLRQAAERPLAGCDRGPG